MLSLVIKYAIKCKNSQLEVVEEISFKGGELEVLSRPPILVYLVTKLITFNTVTLLKDFPLNLK